MKDWTTVAEPGVGRGGSPVYGVRRPGMASRARLGYVSRRPDGQWDFAPLLRARKSYPNSKASGVGRTIDAAIADGLGVTL